MPARLSVHPVTPARWADFEALFSTKGSPHFCWCAPYRFTAAAAMDKDEKRLAMQSCIKAGTPVGVLAYRGDEPVGWCSVAPRETYARLERSQTMPKIEDKPTWSVLCFFIPRPERGTGVALRLLKGGVAYAKAQGAEVVEGYPWDTMGITSTHRGHSALFAAAGFKQEGKRWVKRFRSPRQNVGPGARTGLV